MLKPKWDDETKYELQLRRDGDKWFYLSKIRSPEHLERCIETCDEYPMRFRIVSVQTFHKHEYQGVPHAEDVK
jgi:hypothetical protein